MFISSTTLSFTQHCDEAKLGEIKRPVCKLQQQQKNSQQPIRFINLYYPTSPLRGPTGTKTNSLWPVCPPHLIPKRPLISPFLNQEVNCVKKLLRIVNEEQIQHNRKDCLAFNTPILKVGEEKEEFHWANWNKLEQLKKTHCVSLPAISHFISAIGLWSRPQNQQQTLLLWRHCQLPTSAVNK